MLKQKKQLMLDYWLKISAVFKIPVEAFQNFDEGAAIDIISKSNVCLKKKTK